LAVLSVVPVSFTTMRMDGLTGEQQSQVRWRWSPSAEELFLVERARSHAEPAQQPARSDSDSGDVEALQLQPGDWPGFRGPTGNGEVRDLEINANWNATPPRLVWRQRIGPA